ncbi:hypothetical protein CDD80_4666 [Ophiocordyceps camponoti-rufipedis]|uniref:Uncharacterized protein n=1 Tax=Ophiocordyceps camponoti-rufipedis TaxID=2004952 RepID=A0A2C5YX86_9HYPO|nr:hypothetical protein CDD80_4666 [Ophiocordyceps camponoti-rufipedis]
MGKLGRFLASRLEAWRMMGAKDDLSPAHWRPRMLHRSGGRGLAETRAESIVLSASWVIVPGFDWAVGVLFPAYPARRADGELLRRKPSASESHPPAGRRSELKAD